MNFTAIDFETSNERKTSACAIGITVVENSKVVKKFKTLIKPKEIDFKPMQTLIHGITEEDVKNEKSFKEIWPKIKKYFENKLIIAHNAYFDIPVLLSLLEQYNLTLKNSNYICTVDLCELIYEGLPNNKLDTLGELLNVEFEHHNPLDDSYVAAMIMLDVCKYLEVNSVKDIFDKLGIQNGSIVNNYNMPPLKKRNSKIKKKKVTLIDRPLSKTNIFKNKYIVFTGPLKTISRSKATEIILKLGGITCNSVNEQTNFVISNLSIDDEPITYKLREIQKLNELGFNIQVMNEEKFLEFIYN